MFDQQRIAQVGIFSSILAFSLLLVMLILPWPFDFSFPGVAVLRGLEHLSESEFNIYLQSLRLSYSIDEVFITSWIISCSILCLRMNIDKYFRHFLLLLGLIGPLLDLAENGLFWAMMEVFQNETIVAEDNIAQWMLTRHLSYIIPFVFAMLMISTFYIQGAIGPLLLIVSLLVSSLSIVGLYLPSFEIVSSLWWLLFFIVIAYLNWKIEFEAQ
jgi:hypothetical protein